ncbi:MAG: DUF973 family protein [Thermoplasmata archaeon]
MGASTPPMTWTPNVSTASPTPAAPEEIAGASRIKWGALLGILGLALAIGGTLVVLVDVGLGVTNVTASGYVSLLHTILLAVVLIVVGVFLALLSFVLYTVGFASLRKADRRFSTPMVLCVIGLLGLALIGGFVIFYASAINSAIECPSSNSTCQNNATSLGHGEVALGYGGGLLGFIGLIGAILGLYRFGTRYSSTLAKVGAILYIIPVLSILAPILVFIGAHMVLKRLGQPAPPAIGMPPSSPAPPPPT